MASSTCSDVTGLAYTFSLGTNTSSATATDKAGNHGEGSPDALAAASLAKREFGMHQQSKACQTQAYINEVDARTDKNFTPEQAAILKRLALSL